MKKWMTGVLVLLVVLVCAGCASGNNGAQEMTAPPVTELDLSGTPVADLEAIVQMTQLELLDVRDTGLTTEEYEYLRSNLPGCEILWSVPFQGGYLSEETAEITVSALSPEDVQQLAYLKNLETVHAEGCDDFDALVMLKEANPEANIFCDVYIGSEKYDQNVTEIVLENAAPTAVDQALPFFASLQTVTFTGATPDNEQMYQWKCDYPEITFVWTFELYGVPVTSVDKEVYLNEIPMEDVSTVENALKYFYNLEWVEMCDCGISSEEMDALWKRHPETRFIWKVYLENCVLRTDETAMITYKFGYNAVNALDDEDCKDLKYCVDMVCLDMGHMAITDYSFVQYMPNLQYLIVADTAGFDLSAIQHCKELIYLEAFWTDFSDASVLTGLTKLEDLNLSYTAVTDIEPLLGMTHLKRLWLAGMVISQEDQARLREALPDTIIFIEKPHPLVGATQSGWRQSPNYFKMRDLLGMWYMTD